MQQHDAAHQARDLLIAPTAAFDTAGEGDAAPHPAPYTPSPTTGVACRFWGCPGSALADPLARG